MAMNKKQLSENIRNVRKTAKMTQEQFGKSLGGTRLMVARWELGTRTPSLEYIEKIARCVGRSPVDLFNGVFEVNGDGDQ